MLDVYRYARPILFKLDPEKAHAMTLKVMKAGFMPCPKRFSSPVLEQKIWDLNFPNPVGMAAGFDKNAEVIASVLKLGFGFTEVGTVTPKAQEGNPIPRVFRDVKSQSVINRMGFPNGGLRAFQANLEKHRTIDGLGVIGINIGMNKDQKNPASDYCALIRALGPKADYLTVNISSPNTPGLRNLQDKDVLKELLALLLEEREKSCTERKPPLLVKLAPDLNETQQQEISDTLLASAVDGVILTNTTLTRPNYLPDSFKAHPGGLSGLPLRDMSTQMIRNFRALTNGKLIIIGVGGISSGMDAYEKIRAGASLVQLYSALVFQGPEIAHKVNSELSSLLLKDGYSNISEAVGAEKNLTVKIRNADE